MGLNRRAVKKLQKKMMRLRENENEGKEGVKTEKKGKRGGRRLRLKERLAEEEREVDHPQNAEEEEREFLVKYGRSLCDSNKDVRDKGMKSLRSLIKKNAEVLTILDYVKIWKCFFWAMYMSDKKPVQQNLCVNIAKVTRLIPYRVEKFPLYLAAMLEVCQQEWVKLDTWRMNKFLLMVKIFYAELYQIFHEKEWNTKETEEIIEKINELYLTVAPLCKENYFNSGLAMHVGSCFWSEIIPLLEPGVVQFRFS